MKKFTSNKVAGVLAGLLFVVGIAVIMNNPPVAPQAMAQAVGIGGTSAVFQVNAADACMNPTIAKVSAVVNITTATTTALSPVVVGKAQYVCSVRASIAGAQTFTFVTGTGTNCGTGTVTTTGAIAATGATNGAIDLLPNGMTSMISPKGGQVCITTTTTGSTQGIAVLAEQ